MFLAKTIFAGCDEEVSHRLRLCHYAAVDTCLKPFGTSAAPQKRGLKDFLNAKHFGVRQSLRKGHCRTEAAIFPRGKMKNLPHFEKIKGLAVNLWKTRPIRRRSCARSCSQDAQWSMRKRVVAEQVVG
jgi:hypothetical protein